MDPKGDQNGIPFWTKRGPKGDPFLDQKGTKRGTSLDQKGDPFWSPFGPKRAPLLVPFWARKGTRMGSPFGPKGDRKWARNKYLPGSGRSPGRRFPFRNAVKSKGVGLSAALLIKIPGPISGRLLAQKGIPFWSTFGSTLDTLWVPFGIPCGSTSEPLWDPRRPGPGKWNFSESMRNGS